MQSNPREWHSSNPRPRRRTKEMAIGTPHVTKHHPALTTVEVSSSTRFDARFGERSERMKALPIAQQEAKYQG
jgi:hypothetical protein